MGDARSEPPLFIADFSLTLTEHRASAARVHMGSVAICEFARQNSQRRPTLYSTSIVTGATCVHLRFARAGEAELQRSC
jgi:hypothetical protein